MNKPTFPLLSVIVPCYNEQDVINATHQRLMETLGDNPEFTLEIIYVNDGSRDQTEALLFDLAGGDSRVKVISLSRNFGHQPAVTAGLAYATGDIIGIIDADLQDPPEVILQMINKWREGFDVVYGIRTHRKEGLFKRLSYASFYRLYRSLASVDVQLNSGDFALLDRRVADVLNSLPEKNRFIRGLRAWTGFRQTGLVYERAVRAAGESKYSFKELIKLAFDGIFNFFYRSTYNHFHNRNRYRFYSRCRCICIPAGPSIQLYNLWQQPRGCTRLFYHYYRNFVFQRCAADFSRHSGRIPWEALPGGQNASSIYRQGSARSEVISLNPE